MSTILSDELLSELMAVGQVDVLVGLPTLNHSDSVGPVVRAAHVAFNRELARERTVLLNVDGGSTDGTPDIVRDASIVDRRDPRRLAEPAHAPPHQRALPRRAREGGRAAHRLRRRRPPPGAGGRRPRPRDRERDPGVGRRPRAARARAATPTSSRPPTRATRSTAPSSPRSCGRSSAPRTASRSQEPLAGEFGCSGRFAARCLEEPAWESDDLRLAIDLWISGMAAGDGLRVAEVALGPRRLSARPRPAVAALVPQVLDALFTCLRLQEGRWTARPRAIAGARAAGAARALPEPPAAGRRRGLRGRSSARGWPRSATMLERVLRPATLDALRARGGRRTGAVDVPDELWAAVAARARGRAPARHRSPATTWCARRCRSTSAAWPRSPPRWRGSTRAAADDRLEALCLDFERSRGDLVALWTAPAR